MFMIEPTIIVEVRKEIPIALICTAMYGKQHTKKRTFDENTLMSFLNVDSSFQNTASYNTEDNLSQMCLSSRYRNIGNNVYMQSCLRSLT